MWGVSAAHPFYPRFCLRWLRFRPKRTFLTESLKVAVRQRNAAYAGLRYKEAASVRLCLKWPA